MTPVVIQTEQLSKQYKIGQLKAQYQTLRDSIMEVVRSHWHFGRNPKPDTVWALNNVSFEVRQGDILGVVGRNGAGKTTLLKILSRITEPTKGEAKVCGRVGSLLEVGIGFHNELTGRENIYLSGAILGMKKREIDRKLDEIIAFAEIEKFIDTPVKFYSSGMYLRLAFAVAAHLESEILLVDEVLAVGDMLFQNKCLGKMDEVRKEGRTILFISHNMAALSTLCNNGIWLENGKIVASGKIADVVNEYIAKGPNAKSERCWDRPEDAPGNDLVRFKSIRVFSQGEVAGDLRIDRDILVEMEFWNHKPGAHLAPMIHLLSMGTDVLASTNMASACLNGDPWSGRPYPVGLFKSSCKIPANFLNEGRYTITALIMTDNQRIQVKLDEVVSFTVHETGEMRKEFKGAWSGLVRPRLEWRTELQT